MNINKLRNNISSIDRRLLELIAERQRLVSEIGRSKQYTGLATRDFEREKDVLNMARQKAESISIDPNIAEEIMRILIRSSLTSQERDRVIAEGKGVSGRSIFRTSVMETVDEPRPLSMPTAFGRNSWVLLSRGKLGGVVL